MAPRSNAILLISCPDQTGLVATVTQFIHANNGNIVHLDQHVDPRQGVFLMKLTWDIDSFWIPRERIAEKFEEIAKRFSMDWSLRFSDHVHRIAVFVSKQGHCLHDILAHTSSGEWNATIPLIISNHTTLEPVAKRFDIPFAHVPIDSVSKTEAESKQLDLLEQHDIDLVVLARYMQIVSDDFVRKYPNRIINIHHSFLPAFAGAKPYHAAHDRGVKIIGATSHYVTAELDAGPIIEQDVERISHKDNVRDLLRKGQDLEKVVLSRAIWHHINHDILVYGNKTAVFG